MKEPKSRKPKRTGRISINWKTIRFRGSRTTPGEPEQNQEHQNRTMSIRTELGEPTEPGEPEQNHEHQNRTRRTNRTRSTRKEL